MNDTLCTSLILQILQITMMNDDNGSVLLLQLAVLGIKSHGTRATISYCCLFSLHIYLMEKNF